MLAQLCPVHRAALELVPAEPLSRCPNCHYMTHHLHFDHCPECGRRMQIEEPEPRWCCPLCSHAARKTEEGRSSPPVATG